MSSEHIPICDSLSWKIQVVVFLCRGNVLYENSMGYSFINKDSCEDPSSSGFSISHEELENLIYPGGGVELFAYPLPYTLSTSVELNEPDSWGKGFWFLHTSPPQTSPPHIILHSPFNVQCVNNSDGTISWRYLSAVVVILTFFESALMLCFLYHARVMRSMLLILLPFGMDCVTECFEYLYQNKIRVGTSLSHQVFPDLERGKEILKGIHQLLLDIFLIHESLPPLRLSTRYEISFSNHHLKIPFETINASKQLVYIIHELIKKSPEFLSMMTAGLQRVFSLETKSTQQLGKILCHSRKSATPNIDGEYKWSSTGELIIPPPIISPSVPQRHNNLERIPSSTFRRVLIFTTDSDIARALLWFGAFWMGMWADEMSPLIPTWTSDVHSDTTPPYVACGSIDSPSLPTLPIQWIAEELDWNHHHKLLCSLLTPELEILLLLPRASRCLWISLQKRLPVNHYVFTGTTRSLKNTSPIISQYKTANRRMATIQEIKPIPLDFELVSLWQNIGQTLSVHFLFSLGRDSESIPQKEHSGCFGFTLHHTYFWNRLWKKITWRFLRSLCGSSIFISPPTAATSTLLNKKGGDGSQLQHPFTPMEGEDNNDSEGNYLLILRYIIIQLTQFMRSKTEMQASSYYNIPSKTKDLRESIGSNITPELSGLLC